MYIHLSDIFRYYDVVWSFDYTNMSRYHIWHKLQLHFLWARWELKGVPLRLEVPFICSMDWLKRTFTGNHVFFSTNYRGSCRFSLSPIQWYAENPAIIFRCWIIDDWIDWSQNSGLNHLLFWDCELTHSRNTVYATTSTKGWDRNSSKWFPTSNGSGHGFKVILPIIFRGRNFQPSSN